MIRFAQTFMVLSLQIAEIIAKKPILTQMGSPALKNQNFENPFWHDTRDMRHFCPHFMVPSLQMAEITANNGKWAKINTGPYGQPPLKIKIVKIGLRYDRCRPKKGLQPKFHETWIFGGSCAAARLRRVCNHPAFVRKSKF